MLKYKIYINDILDSIKQIENVRKDKLKKSYAWDVELMRLQVVGESVKKIPKEVKKRHSEINWRKFSFLRNIISHAYSNVLPEEIEDIINNELPKLKKALNKIK